LTVDESQKRLQKRNELQNVESCRLERENIEFFDRIRSEYNQFAENEPNRFIILNAEGDIPEIQEKVAAIVLSKLKDQI